MATDDGEAITLVAPMPQPEAEVERPPVAVDAVVAQMPPPPPPQPCARQEEGEQPTMAVNSVGAPMPPSQPEKEEGEKPTVAADAVVVPVPPAAQPEEEEQVPAAALPQPLESDPGPMEEGYKQTLQDENPLRVSGPADEGDKDTSQDKTPLQVPGPADEGDKVTLQDEDPVDDSHDYRDRSPGRYPRDYDDLFHGGRFWSEQRDHRCYDDPYHGGRYRGDHRDYRDYVEALHGDRCRGEQGDPRYYDGPSQGGRYRGGHRDHRDYVDALHGGRCRGHHRDHRDCVDALHGGRCRGDHRDHRDCVDALHGGRRGEQGDHRDYDHAFHRDRYRDDHRDHRQYEYFLNRREQRDHSDHDLAFHGGRYSNRMNGVYYDNPLDYPNDYFNRCGCMKCRFGGRRMLSDYTNQYNPMDSLDDKRVYAHTPCCFRNLICAKNDYPVGASLINPGKWTCFLNCILQCVVHTVPLVSKLLKDHHLGLCPSGSDEFCCYCSLRHHAAEAIRLSGNVLYPKKFVKLLKLISQDFRWGGHQDAHEFLRCLLDKLDDASVAPKLSSEEPFSIVKQVFGGQLKSQLHCPECNHCSDRLESFLDLSLEINQMDTVLDSLESFTKIEVVENFICDGCKSRVDMEKHLKVEQAPEVLVIQLKRFENLGSGTSKIQDMVKYQLELDLKPFMNSTDTDPQNYDLYGVVEHLGNSSKGHYVCYIRSSETDWYLFNDDQVMKLSDDGVLDRKAYLLFYVKQGSCPWFSTLLEQKNILLLDYLQELAEKGLNEDGVPIDSDKGSGSGSGSGSDSDEQDSAEILFGGPAARDETRPSSIGLSQKPQGNANGSTNIPDKNEASCCSSLGGVPPSGEAQKPTSLPPSRVENGNARGLALLLDGKESVSPRGSHDDKEMSHITHGSPSQVNGAGSQGGPSQKNEGSCSLLQSSSDKHEEGCCPENSALHKDDEMMGEDDEIGGPCDSPAGEVRAHYGVETRARKRMRQQSAAAATTSKWKEDGGLKNSLGKKKRVGWAARGRPKKKRS